MKKVDIENNRLIIVFKCPDFHPMLQAVKSLEGRMFFPEGKYWSAPDNEQNREILKKAGFEFTAKASHIVVAPTKPKEVDTARIEVLKAFLPEFRDYQLEGISFVEKTGSGLIADEMGLGKSAQAVGCLKVHQTYLPALIVCPATLKFSWRDQILKWNGNKSEIKILEGEKPTLQNFPEFTIINYDILHAWMPVLTVSTFNAIIGDEIQYIASSKAIRTQAFKHIAKQIKHKILLSGTPIRSRTAQFFNVLNLLDPQTFDNEYRFLHNYCDPQLATVWTKINGKARAKQVWQFNGSTNWEELREKILPLMIRREKKEVLKDLPAKQKIVISLPVSKKEYENYLNDQNVFAEWAIREKNAHKDKKKMHIEHLKEAAYLAKRQAVVSWIRDYIEDGKKFVVFVQHTQAVLDLYQAFKGEAVMIDGSVKDRETPVKEFWNNPKIKLFVGQINAAGVGLNLQCASAMGIAEFPWTPADAEQAEDRIHRLGQEADSVFCYYFVAEGTIDVYIADMLTSKNRSIKRLIDGNTDARFFENEQDIIDNLLTRYGGLR